MTDSICTISLATSKGKATIGRKGAGLADVLNDLLGHNMEGWKVEAGPKFELDLDEIESLMLHWQTFDNEADDDEGRVIEVRPMSREAREKFAKEAGRYNKPIPLTDSTDDNETWQ